MIAHVGCQGVAAALGIPAGSYRRAEGAWFRWASVGAPSTRTLGPYTGCLCASFVSLMNSL